MVPLFDSWVRSLGAFGYPLLGLAALLEYLFPPLPGDSVTLLGGAYIARGERSAPGVLLAVTIGSMVGIAITYRIGQAIGDRVDRLHEGKLLFGITHAQIRRAQALMRRRGDALLIANRFLPSFRAVLFVAAGAAHLPFKRVLAFGTISALLWNSLLLGVGVAIGDNAERIEAFFETYRRISVTVVGLVAVVLLARWLVARRRTA